MSWFLGAAHVRLSLATSDSSDTDDSVEQPPSDALPATRAELVARIEELQLENTDYRDQLRTISSGTSPSPSTGSTPVSISSPDAAATYGTDWDKHGRWFCVLYEVWPERKHLTKPYPETVRQLGGPWHSQRYRNSETKREAIVAELYHFIPEHFHVYLESSPVFAKTFKSGAKSMRSYLISNIRNSASAIFSISTAEDYEGCIYARGFDRSRVPEIAKLLGNPTKPEETYPRFASILYKDGIINGNNIFCSDAIINILKVIFLGSTSITRDASATRSGPKSLATMLELEELTPGSVALAAILARFILSTDLTFREKGSKTRINYHEDFDKYKSLILKSIKSPGMVAIFQRLNYEVLGIPYSSADAMAHDVNDIDDDEAEEERMTADLWGEAGSTDNPPTTQTSVPVPPTTPAEPEFVLSAAPATPSVEAAEPETMPSDSHTGPKNTTKTRSKKAKDDPKVATDTVVGGDTLGARPTTRKGGRK